MLKETSELAPRAIIFGALIWGSLSYFVAGPEIASRVAETDFLPACQVTVGKRVERAMAEQAVAVTGSRPSGAADAYMRRLEAMRDSPIMQDAQTQQMMAVLGLDTMVDAGVEEYNARKEQAEAAYKASVAELEDAASTSLARTNGACGCAADFAIAETRTEWAVYVGTVGLIRPKRLDQFDAIIGQAVDRGECVYRMEART